MNLVLFTHPAFLEWHSHANFTRMLVDAFRERGHSVAVRQPAGTLHRRTAGSRLAKWAGYADQYLVFPRAMRAAVRSDPRDTLYVFCDQALGPWIPAVAGRPHVVHCMDLLALRAALGDVPEVQISASGRAYQRFIQRGFRRARHFISISNQSRDDLHRFGGVAPLTSEVVYLGLSHPFRPVPKAEARSLLRTAGLPADERGCILNISGGGWYKNGVGVARIYAAYARDALAQGRQPLPLWLVGPPPKPDVAAALQFVPPQAEVQQFSGLSVQTLEALYSHAAVLLFPSLAEGFGWPIVEAQACGCPVITTGAAPMTEVGGEAATYLPRLAPGVGPQGWADSGAQVLARVLARTPEEQAHVARTGLAWAARFAAGKAIDGYLGIYERVLSMELNAQPGAATR